MGFDVLDIAAAHGCEGVHVHADTTTGLRAVIAVHSTVLGPALGGARFRPYPDEHAAVLDVCRLARGMTYKHAACGNDQGGGKAVIIGDPAAVRTDELVLAFARFVDSLGGRYVTAEDVGTTQADMDLVRTVTSHATGFTGGSGDPSPATAVGVQHALGAVSERLWGSPDLAGRHVAVMGVGKVGGALARSLAALGARVTVSDVRVDVAAALAEEIGAAAVPADAVLEAECDVLAPCALGAVLSEVTIPRLRCAAVCGAANNQLAHDDDAARLAAAGVLYAPDYVVNAGGVINIAAERAPGGYDQDRAYTRIGAIADTLRRVLALADAEGIDTAAAADRIAEERLRAATAQPS